MCDVGLPHSGTCSYKRAVLITGTVLICETFRHFNKESAREANILHGHTFPRGVLRHLRPEGPVFQNSIQFRTQLMHNGRYHSRQI
jgi:hypothetical protein